MAKVNSGLRLEPEALEKVEELARLMSGRAGGAHITPTMAARAALDRGIAVLLTELGGDVKKGGKAPRKAK